LKRALKFSRYRTLNERGREDAWVYTDDQAGLPEAMSRAIEKSRALDVVRVAGRLDFGS
jgi:hypothetical protein